MLELNMFLGKYVILLEAQLIIFGIHTGLHLQNTLWIIVTMLRSLVWTFSLYWVSRTLHLIWKYWRLFMSLCHHHHHGVPLARISRTLSHHFSLSFIASSRSSGLHPVSSHSCCMYVRAGRPAFARPYVGVHRSTSLMSSSLLLQQCSVCLVRLTWIVFVIGGRRPYSWCFVGCCRQDLFNIALNILV